MKSKIPFPFILIILLSVILIIELIYYFHDNPIIPTFNQKTPSTSELKDELLITLFMNHIESDSSTFYNNYFNTTLEYYDYETKILDIKNGNIPNRTKLITFGSTPMIGAHNPVGYDKITYSVDVLGNVTLDKFSHLKSFDVPEWLRDSLIKPYPVAE